MIIVACPKCQMEYLAADAEEARRIGLLHVSYAHPVTSPEVPA